MSVVTRTSTLYDHIVDEPFLLLYIHPVSMTFRSSNIVKIFVACCRILHFFLLGVRVGTQLLFRFNELR